MDERLYRNRIWTDEQLKEAAPLSRSIEELSRRLGLKSASAGHRTLPKHLKRLGLSTEHMVGRRASGNRTKGRFNERPLEGALINGSDCSGAWLKRKLIDAGLLKGPCAICKINKWQGKKLVLQMDHVNGNRRDNRLENLRLICPNCHSQTDTYAGRNSRGRRGSKYLE